MNEEDINSDKESGKIQAISPVTLTDTPVRTTPNTILDSLRETQSHLSRFNETITSAANPFINLSSASNLFNTQVDDYSSVKQYPLDELPKLIRDLGELKKDTKVLKQKIDLFEISINKLENTKTELTTTIKKLVESAASTTKSIEDSKTNVVEVVGVLVAVFAFVSLNFKLLDESAPQNVLFVSGLILACGGLLLGFVLAMHLVLNSYRRDRFDITMLLVLCLISIALIGYGLYRVEAGSKLILTEGNDGSINNTSQQAI